MTNEVTSLVLGVDSTQIPTAENRLDKLTAAGGKAATAADALADASKRSGAAAGVAGAAYNRNAQAGVQFGAATQGAGAAVRELASSANKSNASLALTSFQTQNLAVQVKDFFESIVSGASPLRAFAQQAGTSISILGGFGNAFRFVGSAIASTTFLAAAAIAVVAGLGYAAYSSASQVDELNKALLTTNNYAGKTVGEIEELNTKLAKATNVTAGTSRAVLQELVASGRFTGDTLASAANAAILLSKATGKSSEDIVSTLITLSNGVRTGAEKLNQTYHSLTADQLKYIKTLEDQGDAQKALKITLDALANGVSAAAGHVGILERAWNNAKIAVTGYIDKTLEAIGFGKTDIDSLIRQSKQSLDELRTLGQAAPAVQGADAIRNLLDRGATVKRLIADEEDRLRVLKDVKATQDATAQTAAKNAVTEEAKTKLLALQEQYMSKQLQLKHALDNANAIADKAGLAANDPTRLSVLAGIMERFNPGLDKAALARRLQEVQGHLELLLGAYSDAERGLESLHSAGLLSEHAYYNEKRNLLRDETNAEVAALLTRNRILSTAKVTATERAENDKTIAENVIKIARLRATASTSNAIFTNQETASLLKLDVAYEQATISAEAFLRTQNLQQNRELAGIGAGGASRSRQAALDQINDKFRAQREEQENQKRLLTLEGKFGLEERVQYEVRLDLIDRFQKDALISWDLYYAHRQKKEQDFTSGASEAMANYMEASRNVAQQTEQLFTRAFTNIEDALVNFVMTGKLDFKSLANSIIADILRIQIKAEIASRVGTSGGSWLSLLTNLFGSGLTVDSSGGGAVDSTGGADFGSGGFLGGGRAAGGPVRRGTLYPVNELGGPGELFNVAGKQYLMPSQDGQVSPQRGGITISPTIQVAIDSRTDQAEIANLVSEGVSAGMRQTMDQLHAMGRV